MSRLSDSLVTITVDSSNIVREIERINTTLGLARDAVLRFGEVVRSNVEVIENADQV